jgi:hypothetical protein
LSNSTWLKRRRSLALATRQHYGDINEEKGRRSLIEVKVKV